MYKRLSAILFPIVTILFIGAIVWGYQEHQDKNSVLIKAENQYQRAFHDLSFYMDQLHTEIGNALAVSSTAQNLHEKSLLNVWRISSQAQSDINQLPLTLLPFNKTEEFLANISKFAYQSAISDFSKKPTNKNEMKTLQTLYNRSDELSSELRGIQQKVINQNLRWMDVELALATENKTMDNTIIDGFKTVNKKVTQYSEVNWGPSMATTNLKRNYNALGGSSVSMKQIQKKTAQFFHVKNAVSIHVVENGKKTDYSSYSATFTNGKDNNQIHADFTKKGGLLIWYMNPRPVNKTKLDVRQARDQGLKFLDQHGYPNMTAVSVDHYDNAANITFAHRQNDVIIYPEKITVKVALDNGEVIGIEAGDYIMEKKQRQLSKPVISSKEAEKQLNPNFKVTDVELAVIKDDLNHAVQCYQFSGDINGGKYRIYVNTDTGYEEKIEKIREK